MKKTVAFSSLLFIVVTLILKLSGLLRDIVIAYYFGDSYVADAYLAAFIIPNLFILFFTTGMKNALVPSYIEAIEQQRGQEHLGHVFKGTILISFCITVVGAMSANAYIPILYPQFSAEAKTIAIWVSVILFAAIFMIGMNAVLEAYFDAVKQYTFSAFTQILLLFTVVLSAVLFANQIGAYSLAFGYLAGSILSLVVKLAVVKTRRAMAVRTKMQWKEVKRFYRIFIPVALTVAVGQINLAIDNVFAGYFGEGAVTYINYAKNLVHFPQAIFGVTIGTIIFPLLSKAMAQLDHDGFKRGIEQGLMTMFYILLPAIVGLMLLMPAVIELLYERGAFGREATAATSYVSYFYVGSVLFFSIHNIINKGFYTLKKGHLILMIGGLAIGLNILFNVLFTRWIGYYGIPLASSVMAFFYVGTCFVIFYRLVGGLQLSHIGMEYSRIITGAFIMAAALYFILPTLHELPRFVYIFCSAVIGGTVYVVVTYFLQSTSLAFFLQAIKRQKG
ncbi:murein biosynthesis integral membrane protein MurJ [Salirhabdus salicampi]|uniref:murein biosynthesis integral membrane protein MurJ n=1 Tax=Salirhabdus salicampi TaxID=476102 RepID=UPI0020C20393|nr:murein biosynthesis integral membrane protein MurJ [Salirhabdus salicampi]MCP8617492.1 murein biosynthesis integral membrane protein MurJ [Salirhabdus salicampi]